jgi:phage-related protein
MRRRLSGDQVRILYFFCYKDFIVLTNWFTKNTGKVPVREIEKARKLRNDFIHRISEQSLRNATNENT